MTTESAIQQDVQTTDKRPAKTDRMSALEEITARRNADFERETGVRIEATAVTPLDPDADPEAAAAEAERARLEAVDRGEVPTDEDAAQRALQQAQAEPPKTDLDPKAKVKAKIDGTEQEVTVEELLREYQKGKTADKRLSDLAQERRQLEEERKALESQQASIQQASQPNGPEVEISPEVTTKFAAALKTGDEAQLTQAFNEAVSSAVKAAVGNAKGAQATQAVDPQAIAAQVRQQIAIESVLAQSRADYPQLYADPDIEAVAASKISRLQAEGKPFAEALESVQTDLATKFGWKKAVQSGRREAAPDTNRREEKLARKAQMDVEPSGLSVKSGTTEEKPASVHDVIREMAAKRGQVV